MFDEQLNLRVHEELRDIPDEHRMGLVCKQSGGAIFPGSTGVRPVIWIRASVSGKESEPDRLIVFDLQDALVLKKSIDRTVAWMEQHGKMKGTET